MVLLDTRTPGTSREIYSEFTVEKFTVSELMYFSEEKSITVEKC